ncbi:hypothetical protein CK203_111580 [Vitis vinifera]|uniref:Endonuclease/exonuclease/phosphatase domain-containing protein n=1 Tax=Vitis vinifera TaxID=29760 RepID=A0A438C8X7_VITVI|nr:hypothetical protein CK203_111580 [Vitis vinifera]
MWVQGLRQRQAFCVGVTMREDDQERTFEEGLHLLAPLFSLFGIPWVLLQSVEKVLCGWHENFVIEFVKRNVGTYTPLLAGNSVYMDFLFLKDALSWNVRAETKIKETSTGLVRSLGVGRHLDQRAVNSRGAAGGILVFWDNKLVELVDVEEGEFSISYRFKNCVDGLMWVFTGVYGPVCNRDKEEFWEELGSIKGLWNDPWCVGGDFNMVRYPEERSKGGGLSASMRRFSEVGILPRPVSDHFPILLEGGGMKRGPSPFRFENMWLEEKGFKDQMKKWWGSLNFIGTYNFVLDAKLRALKDILKTWNKEVFGLIDTKKGEALK